MKSFLAKIFGKGKPFADVPVTYDGARDILEGGSNAERVAVASNADSPPEALYYLSSDKSASVRREIARNAATPIQADHILGADEDEDVRAELARKISRLMPDLDRAENAAVRDLTIEVLDMLARDQLPQIRQIVAEEIKTCTTVPRDIVTRLAADVESVVSVPILEYSPLLNDDDLREIIAAGTVSEGLAAIARRDTVPAEIADDIAASLDVPAIADLLTNKNAQIREDTLDRIITQATETSDLHRPLTLRPELSVRSMKRIAGFVASALIHAMCDANEVEDDVAEELIDKVRERLSKERVGDDEAAKLAAKARDLYDRGALDDTFFTEALDQYNTRELLIQCLAVVGDVEPEIVRKVMMSKSGRAVTALAWRAKLTMRTAVDLQTKLGLVPPAQLVYAKDGVDYPMDEGELTWHLSYFLE